MRGCDFLQRDSFSSGKVRKNWVKYKAIRTHKITFVEVVWYFFLVVLRPDRHNQTNKKKDHEKEKGEERKRGGEKYTTKK